ncbi:Thioredoxin domain-containing protein 9 [Cichlidogyrus casuarinus]|uniref:Thioredoxin domain-containing protein 9 n=1 Tax=Cichlidogyrus casuarinus TaxID=1844966 RepID=A0ABD2PUU0_9PLAT
MASGQNLLEKQLIGAAKLIENQLDRELERLDNLGGDDLEAIKQKRLNELKEKAKLKDEWLTNGHGVYTEVPDEKAFFACNKKSKQIVCQFYLEPTFRCKIVDKHLAALAPKHIECKFVKLNAEKAPFLTEKLNIRVIPTILIIINEQVCDRIVGFDDLGGHDEFSTRMLEWRLAQSHDSISASEKNATRFNLLPEDIKTRRHFIESVKNLVRSCKKQMANPSSLTSNNNMISFAIDLPRKQPLQSSEELYGMRDSPKKSPERNFSPQPHALLQDQKNIITEQNERLDQLGSSITKLKDMSHQIGLELDDQTNLLDEFHDDLSHTESRLDASIKRVEKVLHLSTDKRQWSAIIGLSITLFVILLLLAIL